MKVYSYIRFSSALQARGDSLRRQTKLARDWCDANGAELVEDLRDLGISAFRGRNSSKGALAAFLASVEAGRIVPGSTLLVESLDRITRTELSDALALFLRIINAGVRVVTLADNRSYERETINSGLGELMMSLVILSRANEESRTKSQRLRAAWQARRERDKLTINGPHWLRRTADGWRVIPQAAKLVRRIFAEYAGGASLSAVVERLNAEGVKAPHGGGWHRFSVRRLLQSRAAIGELALCVARDPVPVRIIAGHYPAIITRETFATVARLLEARTSKPGRAGGENIFRGLAVCPDGRTRISARRFCGSVMRLPPCPTLSRPMPGRSLPVWTPTLFKSKASLQTWCALSPVATLAPWKPPCVRWNPIWRVLSARATRYSPRTHGRAKKPAAD